MDTELLQVDISNPSRPDQAPKHFTFDAVYDETTQQKAFYEESCYDLVEGVMEGYNGTIFAYGQTGCGKTHTMQGYNDPPELRGVIPNSFEHIFENIKGATGTAYLVRCCYLEIYNEEVRDLLGMDAKKKHELKEDPGKGVYVKGLTQAIVSDQESINSLMEQGQKMRTVGATAMNQSSSRSHSIFSIVVEMNSADEKGKDHIRVGKLNLVDLAGSERQSKTGATGDRLKEGCKINLSLSALGNVISALVDGKGKHIPYRDSKLTRLLQDRRITNLSSGCLSMGLGGNTKTLMVAAISPADFNYEETLSTLRYANRAKNIKNKPKINEDPKDAMLRQYKVNRRGSRVPTGPERQYFTKFVSSVTLRAEHSPICEPPRQSPPPCPLPTSHKYMDTHTHTKCILEHQEEIEALKRQLAERLDPTQALANPTPPPVTTADGVDRPVEERGGDLVLVEGRNEGDYGERQGGQGGEDKSPDEG
ncbi:unnamed protein product [Discosporangium mesarthrocarpum]